MNSVCREKKHILIIGSQPLELAEIKQELIDSFDVDLAASRDMVSVALKTINSSAVIISIGDDREWVFSIFADIGDLVREKGIPVIFLAESENSDDENAAFKMGAVDYTTRGRGAVDALVERIQLRIRAAENENYLANNSELQSTSGVAPTGMTNDGIQNAKSSNVESANADSTNAKSSNAVSADAELPNAELPNAELPNTELPNTELPNVDSTNAKSSNADSTNTESANAEPTIAGRTVLIADDIKLNRDIIASMFSDDDDLKMSFAANGREAVEAFERAPASFAFILMDVQMPVMDGLEATRTIRRLGCAEAKSIPIIALTADAHEDEVERCLRSGMSYVIEKPLEYENLMAVMNQHCVAL